MTARRTSVAAIGRLARRCLGAARTKTASPRPIQPDEPDDPRARVTQRVLSSIHNNSILLCGPPGSGKTAVLLDLKERLTGGACGPACWPVYVNLRGVPESTLFVTVAAAVLDQLGLAGSETAVDRNAGYGHRDLAHDIRGVIRTLKKRDGGHPRVVLLVDGIDALNDYAPRTTQRVRSLFMMSLDGSLVMVATAVHIDRHWVEEGSPWYNFFEEIEMPAATGACEPVRRPG